MPKDIEKQVRFNSYQQYHQLIQQLRNVKNWAKFPEDTMYVLLNSAATAKQQNTIKNV